MGEDIGVNLIFMVSNKENEITIFAETNFRNQKKRFGIKRSDRRYGMFVVGKTGMGKTNLLESCIISDLENGNGVGVIDPHGDLIERILDRIPSRRINDVIYFNPADTEYPIALNLLDKVSPNMQSVLVSSIISIFKKLYIEFWGPRMEYVFRNAILTALMIQGSTLVTIKKLLVEVDYREKVAGKIDDQTLRDFWVKEFANLDKRQRTEVISPILNKLGQFLSDPMIRNIIGQRKNKIDFRKVMDKKHILLVNLSKGMIGEDNAMLLGSLILTKLQLAAFNRTDIPEKEREDFYLFVDESHNFITENFSLMLAEMRKFRLNLTLANQHLGQLYEQVKQAILGNIGTLISFRVGAFDAEILREEFYPKVKKHDLINLPKYQIYLKLMIDGVVSEGFSATSIAPLRLVTNNKSKIINVSQIRYTIN